MIKVAHLYETVPGIGVGTVVRNLVKYMDRERFEPLIIDDRTDHFTDLRENSDDEVRILNSKAGLMMNKLLSSKSRNPLSFMQLYMQIRKDAKDLRKLLNEEKVDILHTHHHHHHIVGAIACKNKTHCIWQVHGIIYKKSALDWQWRIFNYFARRYASHIIAISNPVRDHMAKSVQQKTTVVHNGIETERFGKVTTAEGKHILGFSPEQPIVGMVGRFVPIKGVHDFISMAEIVATKNKDVHFVLISPSHICSESQYREACLQQINDTGLKDRFTIKGQLSDAASFMPAIDILVHPTASLCEGFGLVVLEAQACGIPAVATDCGGPSDIIVDGQTGYIVPRRDIRALSEQVCKLLSDKKLAERMGRLARARATSEQFNVVNSAHQVEGIYRSILGK